MVPSILIEHDLLKSILSMIKVIRIDVQTLQVHHEHIYTEYPTQHKQTIQNDC